MQEDMHRNEYVPFFCENTLYTCDVDTTDRTSHAETCDVDIEKILLSMYDFDADAQTKPVNRKEAFQARNRACAQQARDADRIFTELLFEELSNITETFEIYATYIGQLKGHVTAAECSRDLELRCATHKRNIERLQKHEVCNSAHTLIGMTTKERNRIHAEQSRYRKNKFLQEMTDERDASLITLGEVMKYTTALESSCSLLTNFDETGHDFMELTLVRQSLFQRTCKHTQQQETLKSRLLYRVVYRSSFRQSMH